MSYETHKAKILSEKIGRHFTADQVKKLVVGVKEFKPLDEKQEDYEDWLLAYAEVKSDVMAEKV